jgi:hypothetical protein
MKELIKFYIFIYLTIAFSGPLFTETVKKIWKSWKSYKNNTKITEIKINPLIIFSILFIFDMLSSIIFTFSVNVPLYTLTFVPITVFCVSVLGYSTIIRSLLSFLEGIGVIAKTWLKKMINKEAK